MEYQWNKRYSIGANRSNRTNGRVECTTTQAEANGTILIPIMRCTSPMEYKWHKCYSIGTNRTNGPVECNPIQPDANKNIASPRNEMRFTNGIPKE